jgi:branched-chain amino acid transport system substrate-binding protein
MTHTNSPRLASHNTVVILRFTDGNFERGFRVLLEIYQDGRRVDEVNYQQLPAWPSLPTEYQQWAEIYNTLGVLSHRGLTPVDGQVISQSTLSECQSSAQALRSQLNQWFNGNEFRLLSAQIRAHRLVDQDDSVPIVFSFETSNAEIDDQLRKLPWHLWNLFRDLPQAEVALSTRSCPSTGHLNSPVRILAIFGSDQGGLDLKRDEESLRQVLGHQSVQFKLECINQPTVMLLQEQLRNADGWDILFFSGHSRSNLEDGYLLISENHSISISSLEEEFRLAIRKGLKLAIFNSCQGLGIADFFAGWSGNNRFSNLPLPSIIVMREPVPDFVARQFFRAFLREFIQGQPIHKAVREARRRLTILEGREQPYPCADWIPIVCLNTNQAELSWPEPEPELKPEDDSIRPWWRHPILGFAALGTSVLGAFLLFAGPIKQMISINSSLKIDGSSIGEEILISPENANCSDSEDFRDKAATAFSNRIFEGENGAVRHLEEIRESCPLDPEILIYLNNAKILEEGKNYFRIAVIVPINDPETVSIAEEILRGVAQAQDEINKKGGIDKRYLQIQIVNDASDIESAASNSEIGNSDRNKEIADALSKDRAVVGVIGSHTSNSTQQVSEIFSSRELTTISPTSTAVRVENFKLPEGYVFRTAPTDAKAVEDMVEEIEKSSASSVGIVYRSKISERGTEENGQDDSYSLSLKNQAETQLNNIDAKVVELCDLSDSGFSAEGCMGKMNNKNVDVILLLLNADENRKAIVNVLSLNRQDSSRKLIGGDSFFAQDLLDDTDFDMDGMLVAVPWHKSTDDNNRAENFLVYAKKLWAEADVNWRTASAYDATQALIGAVSATDKPTRSRIAEQLQKQGNKFNGFLGEETVSFDGEGDRVLTGLPLGTIVQVDCSTGQCEFTKPN